MFTLRINELMERTEPICRYLLDPNRFRPIGTAEPTFYGSTAQVAQEQVYQRAATVYDPYAGAGRGPAVEYQAQTGTLEPSQVPLGLAGGDRERIYINIVTGLPYNQWTTETVGMDWGLFQRVRDLMSAVLVMHAGMLSAEAEFKAKFEAQAAKEQDAFQQMLQGQKPAAEPGAENKTAKPHEEPSKPDPKKK
jgi:hypothetical protein